MKEDQNAPAEQLRPAKVLVAAGSASAPVRAAVAGVGVAVGVHTAGDCAHRAEEENNARKKMSESLMAKWLIELAPGHILDVDAQGVAAQLRFRSRGTGWDKHDRDQAAPLGRHRFFALAVARGFGPIDLPGVLTGRQDIINLDRDNLILGADVGTGFFGRRRRKS